MLKIYLSFLFIVLLSKSQSQSTYQDSLTGLLAETQDVQIKGKILTELIWKNKLNYSVATQFLDQADVLSKEMDNYRFKANIYYQRGCVERFAGNFRVGIKNLEQSTKIYHDIKDTFNIANANYQLGACYGQLGYFEQAQSHYFVALDHYSMINDIKSLAMTKNAIAVDLKNVGREEDAINYFKEALAIYESQNNLAGQADVLHNLANLSAKNGDYEKAIKYYKRQEIFDTQTNYKPGLAYLYDALGNMYYLKYDYYKSIENHKKAIVLWDSLQNKKYIASNKINLAKSLLKIGEINQPVRLINEGIQWAQKERDLSTLQEGYLVKSIYYEKVNKNATALEYHKRYAALKDSLRSEDVRREINELNAKYQLNQKESRILALTTQNRVQELEINKNNLQRILIILLIAFLLMSALALFNYQYQKNKIRDLEFEKRLSSKMNIIEKLTDRIGDLLKTKNKIILRPREEINELLDNSLSNKEYEVLMSIASGKSNKEISSDHFISQNTVKFHLKNIYAKLDVHNRKQAVKKVASLVS